MALSEEFSSLPERHQKRLCELIHGDERFIMGGTYGKWILKRYAPMVVLTTRRVLEPQRVGGGERVEEVALSAVERVATGHKHDKGRSVIEIEGMGIYEEFALPMKDARPFTDAIRTQLGERKETA